MLDTSLSSSPTLAMVNGWKIPDNSGHPNYLFCVPSLVILWGFMILPIIFPHCHYSLYSTIWVWWRRWKKCTAQLAITSNAQQFLPFRCHIVRMEQNHTCVSLNSTDSKIILYGENCSCKIMVKVSIWYANDDL